MPSATIPAAIATASAVAGVASTAVQIAGVLGGGGSPTAPEAGPPPAPPPPPPPPTPTPGSAAAIDKTTGFQVPSAMTMPTGTGLRQDMNPLQQRAYIATEATQGGPTGSYWKTQPGVDYYKNLVSRSLIDPQTTGIGQSAQVLPVERQYVTQSLGLPLGRETPENFATALGL